MKRLVKIVGSLPAISTMVAYGGSLRTRVSLDCEDRNISGRVNTKRVTVKAVLRERPYVAFPIVELEKQEPITTDCCR